MKIRPYFATTRTALHRLRGWIEKGGILKSGNTIVLILISIVWLMPFLWMVSTAFKPTSEIYKLPLQWIPDNPTILQFVNSWNAAPFGRYYLNSLVVAFVTTILVLWIASMLGFALARLKFAGGRIVLAAILASTMIPFQVLLIPFFILMSQLGLVNRHGGLILPYITLFLPFAVFMFRAYFVSLTREIEESARIDGCSWFGVYLRIALPISRPAIATVGIYTFIESWNEFFIALVMTNRETMRTLPVGLTLFRTESAGVNWGELMAGSIMAAIPAIILFLILQRQFISGLTGGAVKG